MMAQKDTSTINKALGTALRQYRKQKGLTLKELARAINKSVASVSKYETGDVVMDMRTFLDICFELHIDSGMLVDELYNDFYMREEETNTPDLFKHRKLYLYYWMESKSKIVMSLVEMSQDFSHLTIYDETSLQDPLGSCNFILKGTTIFRSSYTRFLVHNIAVPEEVAFYSFSNLSQSHDYCMGIIAAFDYGYHNTVYKCLISQTPVEDENFLKEKILISKVELASIKKRNVFSSEM